MYRNALKAFIIKEQDQFYGTEKLELKGLKLDFEIRESEVKFLGLCPFNYSVSYYIGVDWLKENESYIAVKPKIDKLDYIRMFMHCMELPDMYKYVKDIYHVDFTRAPITLSTEDWELTPFLIIHFLSLLEKITKQGLKKNFIRKEENLNGKIKGKIVFSKQLKHNVFRKRESNIFCKYQDYSVDCLENKLLKKVLLFIQNYSYPLENKYPELRAKKSRLLSYFEHVSDDISTHEIKQIRLNPIYKEYSEAIRIGKLILMRFAYSFSYVNKIKENQLPPFWIDMSKLFELYVYSKLKEAYPHIQIEFQAHGKYGYVDFLDIDNKIIIDTKYKLCYEKEQYKGDDIRQLSGYARDVGILKKLGYITEEEHDRTVLDCVIIAPDNNSDPSFKGRNLIDKKNKITQFTKFYWCGIRIPTKEDDVDKLR